MESKCVKCGSSNIEIYPGVNFTRIVCRDCRHVCFSDFSKTTTANKKNKNSARVDRKIVSKPGQKNKISTQAYSIIKKLDEVGSSTGKKTQSNASPLFKNSEKSQKPSSNPNNVRIRQKDVVVHFFSPSDEQEELIHALSLLNRSYPELIPEKMTANDLLKKLCQSGIPQECVIRNQTYSRKDDQGKEYLVPRIDLYSLGNSFFNSKLSENQKILFSGKIKQGEYLIDDVTVIDDPVVKDDDRTVSLAFFLGNEGKRRTNFLKSITTQLPEGREKRKNAISSWDEYLDWKYELSRLRIKALKYIAFDFDVTRKQMSFLVAHEDESELKEFMRYLKRDEISVFPNFYSTDRYVFQINNNDSLQEQEAGIPLEFVALGKTFASDEVYIGRWNRSQRLCKHYARKGGEGYERTDVESQISTMESIYRSGFLLSELIFSLSENANIWINQLMRKDGFLPEDVENELAIEFYSDGFLATSQIGDFALIRRLKKAISEYISGRSVSQGLDQWLFDIRKARPITSIGQITEWQNNDLNDQQRKAVEKMVSAPDVCLVQGPPGTGKTTVIAEAIFQFIRQHKRVLVASQANLAVDNALERLIKDPRIRAIRLGSARKIDTSVSEITEENVLKSFYSTLIEHIDKHYLKRWGDADEELKTLENDFYHAKGLSMDIRSLEKEIEKNRSELNSLYPGMEIDSVKDRIAKSEKDLSCFQSILAFCQKRSDKFEMPSESTFASAFLEEVEMIVISLKNAGIVLNTLNVTAAEVGEGKKDQLLNGICKELIERAVRSIGLHSRLIDSECGPSVSEFKQLKTLEEALRGRLAETGDSEVLKEWMVVQKKISSIPEPSRAVELTEDEKRLFGRHVIETSDCMRILDESIQKLVEIINIAIRILNSLIKEIEATNSEMKAIIEKYDSDYSRLFGAANTAIAEKQNELSLICSKYSCEQSEIVDFLNEKKRELKKDLFGVARKEDWEEVFKGFKKWVSDIPDYKQERAISLDSFINGCNVVGVSCTENSKTLTERGFNDFDVVIIDEVSKATPPELLIPMLRGKKIILVGDHRQLPPLFNEHESSYQEVVGMQSEFSDITVELKMEDFNRFKQMVTSSLFEQYFEGADPTIKETLTYQYRMHGDIMSIVNSFYDGYLVDGNAVDGRTSAKEHHLSIESTFGTKMIVPEKHSYWFDSSSICDERIYEHRKEGSKSAANILEAHVIRELLRKMELCYANSEYQSKPVSVGIISFYHEQVELLKSMMTDEQFHYIDVDVNTVDRFQGKEKEVVLVSLVRNNPKARHTTDSFIAAFQRINVAFSRAQNLLIIVGAKDMYYEQPVIISDMNDGSEKKVFAYKDIIENLNMRGAFFSADEVIPEQTATELLTRYRELRGHK